MGSGVVKNIFLAETQNGIHDVNIRHKGTKDNLSWRIYTSCGTQRVNKLSDLNKRVDTEAVAHRCSAVVLKNKKQPLADVLQNRCS